MAVLLALSVIAIFTCLVMHFYIKWEKGARDIDLHHTDDYLDEDYAFARPRPYINQMDGVKQAKNPKNPF